ncbi:host attachment protein [Ovoidimarina sediminis]|uniref:host attachment protein n=1 Tax=Ovoidimarina sediminis TaxID=3079856 RepID=UPI003977AFCC
MNGCRASLRRSESHVAGHEGPVANPRLRVQDRLNADQETEERRIKDQPGRRFDGGAAAMTHGPGSATDIVDPERRQAEAFAEAIFEDLARRHSEMPITGFIIAVPPSFLGILRDKISDDLHKRRSSKDNCGGGPKGLDKHACPRAPECPTRKPLGRISDL